MEINIGHNVVCSEPAEPVCDNLEDSAKPLELVKSEGPKPETACETNFVFKKTNRLSKAQQQQIMSLFARVFEKNMTPEMFQRKYLNTSRGYSYHSLMLNEGTIAGALNAIPVRYKYFQKETTLCLSVDTMIDKCHRGGYNLMKLTKILHEGLIKDGIPFIFGFPNELFYPIQTKILKYRDIGELDYFILPLNIGNIVGRYKFLNPFSHGFCKLLGGLAIPGRNSQTAYNIEKVVDNVFEKHRYDESYGRIRLKSGATCIYRIYEEEGNVRTLYIIDVIPLTKTAITEAVRKICRHVAHSIDIIIYVGKLPSRPAGLFKVPESRKPQKIRMTGQILIPGCIGEAVFDIDNWAVNISNFDVR